MASLKHIFDVCTELSRADEAIASKGQPPPPPAEHMAVSLSLTPPPSGPLPPEERYSEEVSV